MVATGWQTDPWGTHVHVLMNLARRAEYRRVLELGAGRYSTPLFLNRDVFPTVEHVLSIEHDAGWASDVERACNDPRLNLIAYPEPIESLLDALRLTSYDLIFVDNSDKEERRIDTICWVAAHVTTQDVVLHDLERDSYRRAAQGFRHIVIDKTFTPWTGVASNR